MPTIETDVCIIGGGITAAMMAEKLSELRPGLGIIVVEGGNSLFDQSKRLEARRRAIEYGENAWPGDVNNDQLGAEGLVALTTAVGGLALRWGGACNRFSEEDLRLKSMYGLAEDWALSWDDLEKAYVEAERRLNVFGQPSAYPEDRRTAPYPVPAQPLSYNLQVLKSWAEKSSLKFDPLPMAHNLTPHGGRGACCLYDTCGEVCPTGARYSPDFTFKPLIADKRIALHDRTLVRKLVLDERRDTITAAQAVHRDWPDESIEYRARTFVLAAGHAWSPYLLLLSANGRFPTGLANRSDTVGRYQNGHRFLSAQVSIDSQLYAGQFSTYSLISRRNFRCRTDRPFVRHDTRVWESEAGRGPRLRDDTGRLLLGDEVMTDWRARAKGGTARLRAYYEVHPDRDSRVTLNPRAKNQWGDPLPNSSTGSTPRRKPARPRRVRTFLASSTSWRRPRTGKCSRRARAATSTIRPAGAGWVPTRRRTCNSYGRTHDHENLFVAGAPTLPTGGCTNGTLTFVALTLRTADRIAEQFRK